MLFGLHALCHAGDAQLAAQLDNLLNHQSGPVVMIDVADNATVQLQRADVEGVQYIDVAVLCTEVVQRNLIARLDKLIDDCLQAGIVDGADGLGDLDFQQLLRDVKALHNAVDLLQNPRLQNR